MVAAQQRHDGGAASLFTLELRRSTRSAEDDGHPAGGPWMAQLSRARSAARPGPGTSPRAARGSATCREPIAGSRMARGRCVTARCTGSGLPRRSVSSAAARTQVRGGSPSPTCRGHPRRAPVRARLAVNRAVPPRDSRSARDPERGRSRTVQRAKSTLTRAARRTLTRLRPTSPARGRGRTRRTGRRLRLPRVSPAGCAAVLGGGRSTTLRRLG